MAEVPEAAERLAQRRGARLNELITYLLVIVLGVYAIIGVISLLLLLYYIIRGER